MRKRFFYVWLSLCSALLWGNIMGCGPTTKVSPPPSPPKGSPPQEKIKLIVLRLENATKEGDTDKSRAEDRLFGNGIKTQLVKALEQTEGFTVVNNTGPREVLLRRTFTPSGEINREVKEHLGSLADAELIVAGALTTYQLSRESKNTGIEADPVFRETQVSTVALDGIGDTAKRVFGNLKSAGSDRVVFEMWLFDAKTGKLIARTSVEGTPGDSGETIGGLFGQKLATAASETATPMQRALRGGTIKAVNWIADTQAAFRAGTLLPPVSRARPVVKETGRSEIKLPPPENTGGPLLPKPPLPEKKPEKRPRVLPPISPKETPAGNSGGHTPPPECDFCWEK